MTSPQKNAYDRVADFRERVRWGKENGEGRTGEEKKRAHRSHSLLESNLRTDILSLLSQAIDHTDQPWCRMEGATQECESKKQYHLGPSWRLGGTNHMVTMDAITCDPRCIGI